jgi:hypothetical protein
MDSNDDEMVFSILEEETDDDVLAATDEDHMKILGCLLAT